jgi:(E)-4-hydroxy-3-methyl-but-2-enyl pyrophosphate reductase
MTKHRVILAENTGFCTGVRRAIEITERLLNEHPGKNIYSLGPVIHNPGVMRRLRLKGLKTVSSVANIPARSILILPSHGTPLGILAPAKKKKLALVDVICPHVASVRGICRRLCERKRKVIIIGEAAHAEIKALKDSAPGCVIIENERQVPEGVFSHQSVGIISQTTQSVKRFFDIVGIIMNKNPLVKEVEIFNTVCKDTAGRQEEAKHLASRVDALLVIGSATSANTKRLLEIGRSVNGLTFLVEKETGIPTDKIRNARKVGVISGASTPGWLIERVVERIEAYS